MDETYEYRTVSDCPAATLDRSGANVAHGEDAAHARPQDAVGARAWASEDEAVVVDRDRVNEPGGVRCGSEEEVGERELLAVARRRRADGT